MAQMQLVHLRYAIATLRRNPMEEDKFTWPCAGEEGSYSAKATYGRLCQGLIRAPAATAIWRSYAPLKLKIFAWLASQHRIWTSDRRARHGLQELPSPCFTCLREEDNVEHILARCVYAQEVWFTCLDRLQLPTTAPSTEDTIVEWWLLKRRSFHGKEKRGFDSLVICTAWALWKQRNTRVFNRREQQMAAKDLAGVILEEIREWYLAVSGVGGLQRFVRH